MEIFLISKADFFGHPIGTPRGRWEEKGWRESEWAKEGAGSWLQLLLAAEPPSSSLLSCAAAGQAPPDSPRADTSAHPWLVSFFFSWAPLTIGQRQPWSKQGWETPDTVFCSAVLCALHPTPLSWKLSGRIMDAQAMKHAGYHMCTPQT